MKTPALLMCSLALSISLLRGQTPNSTSRQRDVMDYRQAGVDTFSDAAILERAAGTKRAERERIQDESAARKLALRQRAAALQQAEAAQLEAQTTIKELQALDPQAQEYDTLAVAILSKHPGAFMDPVVRTVMKAQRFLFHEQRKKVAGGSFPPEKAAQIAAEEAAFDAVTAEIVKMREASNANSARDQQTQSLESITRLNEQQLEELKKQKEELERIRIQQSQDALDRSNGRR
ncbi:MAG: hypothetical protein WCS31_00935 [Verrucomicrobiae bacterium]